MIRTPVLKKISGLVGSDRFHDSREDRIAYSYDGTQLLSKLPEAIVFPRTTEEISAILRLANEE